MAIPANGVVIVNYPTNGTVPAAGNSQVALAYSFTHTLPETKGHNYLRLKQVDLDARSSFSATRMVKFGDGNAKAIVLHPNPVNDRLQAAVYENKIQIAIKTPNGKTVRRLPLKKGINMINVSTLAPGMYFITVYKQQKRSGTQKLIKM